MEKNNTQTGLKEAGLTNVSSGSFLVGSIQIAVGASTGAPAGGAGAAGGSAGADTGASASAANGVVDGGASAAAANGGADGGANAAAAANGVADGGASAAAAAIEGTDSGTSAAGSGAGAAGGSGVGAAAGPSSKKRRIQRHTQQQITALEMYFKKDAHPNEEKRNELAQTLHMEPMQVLVWFQNKRTQTKSKSKRKENKFLRGQNKVLQARNEYLREILSKTICPRCDLTIAQQCEHSGFSSAQQATEGNLLRAENICLREKVKQLKSAVNTGHMGNEDLQNLPIAFQDSQNPIILSQNPQNLPMEIPNPQGLQIIDGNGYRAINELVTSAADEFKRMAMTIDPLWISCSADGTTRILDQVEYLAEFHNIFGLTRLGYTCEASWHIARVLLSPAQLLAILMNVNEWALIFSSIVSRASTLGVLNEGIDHNTALLVVDAEYHISTPHIPKREICFARYCTQFSDGMWAVVDVSLDNILPNLRNTTCQKKPSGCMIQAMADGTSLITWIEHVYVDYNDVSNMYKHLLQSDLGLGANRWVSILDRQSQRLAIAMSPNVPSTRHFNNLLISSPEGRRGILKFAERMANNFFSGITGPKDGIWTKLNWNFDDDVKLMSTTVMGDPGIQNGTLLSASISFTLSDSPKMVFDFLRDHRCRKEWDIFGEGNNYDPIFNISYGEGAENLVSIFKVSTMRQGDALMLQESWRDAVASHVVFSYTETGSLDVILDSGNPNGQALLPSGFTILPDGPSFGEEGASRTLLTVSFQVLLNRSPMMDITYSDATSVVQFLRLSCNNIKHALNGIDPNAGT
ncbi:homeobox-leucine zipper protein PROTODERMAL FACTOR 2-like [Apium graveolens]|uniref:homeobox-leucine zipper protein PROTODERMAL FACTOR 2-like n=1 Tax=Apium graveolens TaxID=4045 RepID=UPI003D78BF3A